MNKVMKQPAPTPAKLCFSFLLLSFVLGSCSFILPHESLMTESFTLQPYGVPQNPLMGPNGINSMHTDTYLTDTSNFTGPYDSSQAVVLRAATGDECYCLAFTSDETRVVALCINLVLRHNLHLIERNTMIVLDSYELPRNPDIAPGVNYPKSGIYFYMDDKDRAVVSIWKNITLFSFEKDTIAVHSFYTLKEILGQDNLSSAMPGFDGLLWWVSLGGIVGTLDFSSGTSSHYKTDETLDKAFSVDENGRAFILTDYALWCFASDGNGAPKKLWRETYDRGSGKKPGMQSWGSGTSPKLFGSNYNYVAIADNADIRDNLLVYYRDSGKLVCSLPLFLPNQSALDTSYIGYFDSLIAINNYNHSPLGFRPTAPGVSRIDVTPEGNCKLVWQNLQARPQAGLKMSQVTGLIYLNSGWVSEDDNNFYSIGLDFETGEQIYSLALGEGLKHSTFAVSNQLGPSGELYNGDLLGLLAIYPSASKH